MKIMLIAALMFMGCATTQPVKTVTSEAIQVEYLTSIVGEDIINEIVKMLEYNPLMTEQQIEAMIGEERMKILREDKQIQAWMAK